MIIHTQYTLHTHKLTMNEVPTGQMWIKGLVNLVFECMEQVLNNDHIDSSLITGFLNIFEGNVYAPL